MLGDRQQAVCDRQTQKHEREDVKAVNGVHTRNLPRADPVASTLSARYLRSKCGCGTLRYVQKAEPLVEVRVWLPKSLNEWLQKEAKRRELRPSQFIRTHFAAVRERQEANTK